MAVCAVELRGARGEKRGGGGFARAGGLDAALGAVGCGGVGGVKERVEGYTRVFFELDADLFADFHGEAGCVWEVEVVD